MGQTLSAAVHALRHNLKCGHCGARFVGTDSQAKKAYYEGRVPYCSTACRNAVLSQKAREQAIREGRTPRKGVLAGPCKHCGKMFESRTSKLYCSMSCYTKSEQFKVMVAKTHYEMSPESREKIAAKLRKGHDVKCLECGTEFYQKPASKSKPARKFCSTTCYRSYLAKRFDRWVANPEGMALPQCYDEFLDREELSCVVDGCDWKGLHLTLHMNQAHGVRADDFKRATGFNLSTGVIAKPLAIAYREREVVGVAAQPNEYALKLAHAALIANPIRYKSLEGKEHVMKGRALLGPGPERVCLGCGVTFRQKTPMGRTLYCSHKCRDRTYASARKKQTCKTFERISYD